MPHQSSLNRRFLPTVGAAALAAAFLISFARPARADVTSCSSAHESGQEASHSGKLRKAVEAFTACASDDACPDVIRKDCISLRDEATAALPTVTFAVTDGIHEMTGVRVLSDDEMLAEGIDGRAVPLDPGRHHLKVLLPQGRVVSSEILLHEGEKNRLITVQTSDPSRALAGDTGATGPSARGGRELPPAFWLASALSLSSVAVGTTFALLGHGQEQDVVACSPRCAPALHSNLDRARNDYLIANISFGVAGASAITAVVFYLTTPTTATKPPPVVSSLGLRELAVVPTSGGLRASAGFSF